MNNRIRLATVAIFLAASGAVPAAVRTWTGLGSAGSDWYNPANWSPPGVPAPADTLLVNSAATQTPMVSPPFAFTGHVFWTGGFLSGGLVAGAGATLDWTGGVLAPDGSLTVEVGGTMILDGTDAAKEIRGVITNRGSILWLNGGTYFYYVEGDPTYQGEIWNEPGGVIDISGDDYLYAPAWAEATLHNAGLLLKTGQDGVTSFYTHIDNTGTVRAEQGIIQFLSGGELGEGIYQAESGASIQFQSGDFPVTGQVDWRGPGEVAVTGGTAEFRNTTGTVRMVGGTIVGTSMIRGTMEWFGGRLDSLASLTVEAGGSMILDGPGTKEIYGTLVNRGSIVWLEGVIYFYHAVGDPAYQGEIWNEPAGVIDIQCDELLFTYEVYVATLHNAGLLVKSGQDGVSPLYTRIDNTGTVRAEKGILQLLSGGELGGGIFEAEAGAELQFASGHFQVTGLADWRGPGDLAITGGTAEFRDATGTMFMKGGSIIAPSFLRGTLYWRGGVLSPPGSLTVEPGAVVNLDGPGTKEIYGTLVNRGAIVWLDGLIYFYHAEGNPSYQGEIWNEPAGIIDIQCDQPLYSYQGYEAALHNAGLLVKSGQDGRSDLAARIDNSGTIRAERGTLGFNLGGELGGGIIEARAGAEIQFASGPFQVTGLADWRGPGGLAITGGTAEFKDATGTMFMTGGSIVGTSVLRGTLHWQGGVLSPPSSLTVEPGAVLNLDGPGTKEIDGTLVNRGAIVWLDGVIYFYHVEGHPAYQGEIWNEAAGIIDIQCDQLLYSSTGYEATLHNAGLLLKTGQDGRSDLAARIDNSGTIRAERGILGFNFGGELGGGIFEARTGAEIQFASGPFQVTGLADWRGPGDVAVIGGTVEFRDATGTMLMKGGSIAGPSVLRGTLNWNGGALSSLGPLTVEPGAVLKLDGPGTKEIDGTLVNRGAIVWLDGLISFYHADGNPTYQGEIRNEPAGVIDIQCDQTLYGSPGYEATLHNAGLLVKSGHDGRSDLTARIDNSGTIRAERGILGFNFGGELGGGIFEARTGAEIQFASGPFQVTGLADWRGPGDVAVIGGTVEFRDATGTMLMKGGWIAGPSVLRGTLNWNGGALYLGSLAVEPGAVLNLDGPGNKEVYGTLSNRGIIRWLDGTVYIYYQADHPSYQGQIRNEPAGVIDIQCDQAAYGAFSLERGLHNVGLLVKTDRAGMTDVATRFDNTGTIEARKGILRFTANLPGTASGHLAVALGGTEPGSGCPRIHFSGTVALGGTFTVGTRDGFRPSPGDVFQVLTFDAATGDFECITGLDLGNGLHLVPQFSPGGLRLVAETYEEDGGLPRLLILPSQGGVRISWPPSFTGWELLSAPDLPATQWEAIPVSCQNQVFIPFTLPRQFFRLRQLQ